MDALRERGLYLWLIIIAIPVFLAGCETRTEQKTVFTSWVPTEHYTGWILQNWWGDDTCNPVDTPGTRGDWGVAPDGIAGWSTGLTQQDYRIDIRYHGNPNCCGDQSASSRIWIGGNNADIVGINFTGPAAPEIGYSLLMWNSDEITRTEKVREQWHTYTIIKRNNTATLQLDGNNVKTESANSFPTKLIVGGQCWSGCQRPAMNHLCFFGNWNNFGYDITFYSASSDAAPPSTSSR